MRSTFFQKSLTRCTCLFLVTRLVHRTAAEANESTEFFERKIRPVLIKHCYSWHSANAKSVEGEFLIDNRAGWMSGGDSGQVIVSGEPEKSLLLQAMR